MRGWVTAALMVAAVATTGAVAQSPPPATSPKTKLEAFNGASGTVSIKSYTIVGSVKGTGAVSVTAMSFRNPNSEKSTSGLAVEVEEESGRSSYSRTNRSFIDYDEIDGLLQGIVYIAKTDKSITSFTNFEAAYLTRGDLKTVVFNERGGGLHAVVSSGNIGGSKAYLTMDQLREFFNLLKNGKSVLDTNR